MQHKHAFNRLMLIVLDRPRLTSFCPRNTLIEYGFRLPERFRISTNPRGVTHEKGKVRHSQQTTDLITAAPSATHSSKRQMIFE